MEKNLPANAGDRRDLGSISESGRSPGGNGNPFQHSCLGNPMDRGAWWATVHGVAKELDTTEQLNKLNSPFVPALKLCQKRALERHCKSQGYCFPYGTGTSPQCPGCGSTQGFCSPGQQMAASLSSAPTPQLCKADLYSALGIRSFP